MSSDEAKTPYRRGIKGKLGEDPDVRERRCLACGFNFVSQWAGNRICDVCKGLWTIHSRQEVTEYAVNHNSQRSKARARD